MQRSWLVLMSVAGLSPVERGEGQQAEHTHTDPSHLKPSLCYVATKAASVQCNKDLTTQWWRGGRSFSEQPRTVKQNTNGTSWKYETKQAQRPPLPSLSR